MGENEPLWEKAIAAIEEAGKLGADASDALVVNGEQLSVQFRLGKHEQTERASERKIGLRVLVGQKQAIVSSGDVSRSSLRDLAERALDMARLSPENIGVGLADTNQLAARVEIERLDMFDEIESDTERLHARADELESAALAVAGVTNSDGANVAYSRQSMTLAASNGFVGSYDQTSHAISVSVIAGEGVAMESDYDFQIARHQADLKELSEMGRLVGEMACSRLGAKPAETGSYPVLFDRRVAGRLVGALLSAINGEAVLRGSTFLHDAMGERIFAENIDIIDDPCRPRGLASRPFDVEGLEGKECKLIESGRLRSWILDLRTARRLNLPPTGHGSRGLSSPPSPSPSNVHMTPGTNSPAQFLSEIKAGFYVTDLLGFGVNIITGDFSQGARGFWITNGERTHPVNEATIAGNLRDMFRVLERANDLHFDRSVNVPTLRIANMMVAG